MWAVLRAGCIAIEALAVGVGIAAGRGTAVEVAVVDKGAVSRAGGVSYGRCSYASDQPGIHKSN